MKLNMGLKNALKLINLYKNLFRKNFSLHPFVLKNILILLKKILIIPIYKPLRHVKTRLKREHK